MKGDGGYEASFDDHHRHFPHHVHKVNAMVVTPIIGCNYQRLTHGLLRQNNFLEGSLYDIHYHLPVI